MLNGIMPNPCNISCYTGHALNDAIQLLVLALGIKVKSVKVVPYTFVRRGVPVREDKLSHRHVR